MNWKILRPATLAFLVATALFGLGCLTLPDFSADDDGDSLDDPGGGGAIPGDLPAESAFFIFQGWHLRSDAWPEAWEGVDLMVCTPDLSAEDVAEIRVGLPEARLLAYMSVQDIALGLFAGNPYYEALEAAFDTTWCLRRVDDGAIIRVAGWDGTPGSGLPGWIVRQRSAEALAAFHRDVTMAAGWDGMYVDECTAVYPPWRRAIILEQTTSFDYDGDGQADTMDALMAEYETSRAYFTARLREELGPEAVMVANAGGSLTDSALNGITLEGVGDRFTVPQARSMFLAAQSVARSPWVAAAWVTSNGSVDGCREIAETMSGVHYGVVSYFTPTP